jgi:CRP-like cAMP-binding protein
VWPLIKKLSFLQKLNKKDISTLRKLHEETTFFNKHRDISNVRISQAQFLIINHGWAIRYRHLNNHSRQIINYYLPGDVINLSDTNYSISSITPMHVSILRSDTLQSVCNLHPKFKLVKNLFLDNIEVILERRVERMSCRSAYARTIHLLQELFVRLRVIGQKDNNTYSMPLSHELLSDTLGISTIQMIRTLHKLCDDNLIDIQPNKINLLDFNSFCS